MINKPIYVVSLFNGMGTLRQALHNLNIPVAKYWSSEIKPYANKLQQYHFPDVIQVGDIRKWREWDIDWAQVDLIGSGSPCQDLSIAGKRAGLTGDNSKLFWIFVEILNHVQKLNPNVKFLQENVGSAPKEAVGLISKSLGVYPVLINSNLVTAQNRARYYWSNFRIKEVGFFYKYVDIPQPADRKIYLKDIIESGEVDRQKSPVILESQKNAEKSQESLIKRGLKGMRGLVLEKSNTLLESDGRKCKCNDPQVQSNLLKRKLVVGRQVPAYTIQDGLYRLYTQTELERLQGFPDGYTSILSYNQASSVLGDGWTLPVIEHLLKYYTKE
jgi:DNA-cytosine methyltransferase